MMGPGGRGSGGRARRQGKTSGGWSSRNRLSNCVSSPPSSLLRPPLPAGTSPPIGSVLGLLPASWRRGGPRTVVESVPDAFDAGTGWSRDIDQDLAVDRHIRPGAAVERIRARAAVERVAAGAAAQRVVQGVAREGVAQGAADGVLDGV